MNNKGVCRTAPDTPGLVMIIRGSHDWERKYKVEYWDSLNMTESSVSLVL